MNPVYIVDSIRTPRARANQKGGLNKLNPYELLDFLYKDIESKNFFNLKSIDEVILGCVTQFGEQAGNIAKASSLFSEYPNSISGLTINRFCSSSLDAINLAYLKDQKGKKILSTKDNNLHVMNFSQPFSGTINYDKLEKHLYTILG